MTKPVKRRIERDDQLDSQTRQQVDNDVFCLVSWHVWDQIVPPVLVTLSDQVELQVVEQLK